MSKHPRGFAAGVFAVWGRGAAVVGCLRLGEGRAAAVECLRLGGERATVGVGVTRGGVARCTLPRPRWHCQVHFTPSQVAVPQAYLRVYKACDILCVGKG